MTELQELLHRAAGPSAAPTAADLSADVHRGMRALRRRRTGAAGGLLTAAVAVAAIPVALGGSGPSAGGVVPGGPAGSPSSSPTATSTEVAAQQQKDLSAAQIAAETAAKRAALAAALARAEQPWLADGSAVPIHTYDGPALAGSYQPRLMPEGTVVQGGSEYRLTIARADDPDTNPDSFVGKVVVMLSGRAAPDAAEVEPTDDGFSKVVVVPLGHPIDGSSAFEVQYAPGLGWTDDEALTFASSITVLPSALSGKG